MFPSPHDALPLSPRPSLAQYRKLAKDIVKACRSSDADALGTVVRRWLDSLARSLAEGRTAPTRERLDRAVEIGAYAARRLSAGVRTGALADAQFVIARTHGFDSWPKLAAHIDAVTHAGTQTAGFEASADAIVAGDEATLRRLLRASPELARARSTRAHRATLLHYVSANGVEGYRQRTPPNAVRIAEILIDARAEVDAEADLYGGGCTTLGLVATSVHPRLAGVQEALMQSLLDHGADVNHRGMAGHGQPVVLACLSNGHGEAAEYLAERGARLDLAGAAGVGRLDAVAAWFDADGRPPAGGTKADVDLAALYACGSGRHEVAAFLLDRGADPAAHRADGQTCLHLAVIGAHLETVKLLLARGAPLEALNQYGGTVLGQALWSAAHGGEGRTYLPIIETLIAAGAKVPARHPPVNDDVDAVLARHGATLSRHRVSDE